MARGVEQRGGGQDARAAGRRRARDRTPGRRASRRTRRGRRRRGPREISMPGQPASTASGHRSGAAAGSSSAARAAAIVPARARAPRAASRRSSCSSVRARFIARLPLRRRRFPLPAAELAERDPLVEPRLRRQPEHALADRVAQDLLGAARGLQARQERDHVGPLAAVLERVGAEHVGDELARRDRGVDERHLREPRLGARDLPALQRRQRAVAAELHRDEVGRDLTEAAADLRVAARRRVRGERLGEAALLVAEALRAQADREALEHERRQRRPPAVVDLAHDRVGVEVHVVEEDLVELGLARDLAEAADGHAGRVHRHDEHRQALVLGHVGVGAREEQPERRELRVRRPHLLAAEPPRAVVLPAGARLDAGEVRAGGGLREQLAPDLVAVEHRAEVARLLRVGPVGDERRAEHADADRVQDPRDARGRDLLVDDDVLDRPAALAAVLRRPRHPGQPGLGELALPAPARRDVRLVLVAARGGWRGVAMRGEPRSHRLAIGGPDPGCR